LHCKGYQLFRAVRKN